MRCNTCDLLENKIKEAVDEQQKLSFQAKKKKHLKKLQTSRQFHEHCKRDAIRQKSVLLLGDGGDKFGLPRKPVQPKCMLSREKLQISSYMVDVFFGTPQKQTFAYYYQDYNTKSAKLPGICIESFHRTLSSLGLLSGQLKDKRLFICTDNTSKEAKNFYLLGYLQSLVSQGMVKDALFYNLHVGHTHFEADQSIGNDKRFLCKRHLNTLPDTIIQLNSRRKASYTAIELDSCNNWRTEIEKYFRPLHGIQSEGWKCFLVSDDSVSCRKEYDGEYDRTKCILKNNARSLDAILLRPEIAPIQEVEHAVLNNIDIYKKVIPQVHHSWWDELKQRSRSVQSHVETGQHVPGVSQVPEVSQTPEVPEVSQVLAVSRIPDTQEMVSQNTTIDAAMTDEQDSEEEESHEEPSSHRRSLRTRKRPYSQIHNEYLDQLQSNL